MSKTVRTRFAPSPTGFLHVGGVRTALFAWLLAKQSDGQFILRIEDTDQARKVDAAVGDIVSSLEWLGIIPDEGPIYQSERMQKGIYEKWANKLIDKGRAYADPYTQDEVQKFREQAQANKKPFLYRNHRPEKTEPWDGSKPLRFKSDPKDYKITDAVMGEISTGTEVIDDFIIIKSDGFPTYNFAHIVDDVEMQITHVIRGQEFLASLPNYLNLYEALGETPPIFATVPHILNENGNKKLSKRDGAASMLDYKSLGYLPEVMMSFIATLGWNDGTEQEFFSKQELIEKFSLSRIQKSGAQFDGKRLNWVSGKIIRQIPTEDLYKDIDPKFWPENIPDALNTNDYKIKVLNLAQERLKFFSELTELTEFFFHDLPINPELISTHKQLKKLSNDELKNLLQLSLDSLKTSNFEVEDLKNKLNSLLEQTDQKPAVLFSLVRIATTQAPASPSLAETMNVLGKDVCLARIEKQLASLVV